MPRYVPKTYNNRRGLRIIVGIVITILLSTVIIFLSLFFILSQYVVDGQLVISWLDDEPSTITPLPSPTPTPSPSPPPE